MAFYDAFRPVTRADLLRLAQQVLALEKTMSNQQTTIDNITAELDALTGIVQGVSNDVVNLGVGIGSLQDAQRELNAEIAALKAIQPDLNTAPLQAAADAVTAQLNALKVSADQAAAKLTPPAAA